MLSHNQLKHLRSLVVKKYRQQHGHFLVEGDKMVTELLQQTRIGVSALFAIDPWIEKNARFLRPFSDKVNPVTEAELAKISALTTPNQVLAVAETPIEPCNHQAATTDICFFLDGIQDPGNMGSILRVADWFGLPAVYCAPDCVDIYSPKVVQASMGAIFRVPSWEIELPDLLNATPQIPVYGAVMHGENVFEATLPTSGLLVIGNEGRGLSQQAEHLLTHRISIPRHPLGRAESLNAAVAAGILAAAFRR
ncbi:MAG: RNA methyltransferase [Saprospiraceae bacterium]|nr:RNA methyltransferase [Saprospiraceae bacterium]